MRRRDFCFIYGSFCTLLCCVVCVSARCCCVIVRAAADGVALLGMMLSYALGDVPVVLLFALHSCWVPQVRVLSRRCA
jgi:hypothetical protein